VSEQDRLHRLASYEVVDTVSEAPFDRLARLAAELFDAPIALITFVDEDRQWFKARRGLADPVAPREGSFCSHAIALERGEVLVVDDATNDPRFRENALVHGPAQVRFYAGAVLTSPEGHNLGTLCVMDDRTRPPLTAAETARLRALAEIVVDTLELRRVTRRASETQRALELVERLAVAGRKAGIGWPAEALPLRRVV
jgi:GAF domain-containing protein